MTLNTAIDTLRGYVSGLTGMRRVYDDPPEAMSEYPCAIVYVLRGNYEANAAGGRSYHTLITEIHHTRQVLPEAMDAAKVWPDRMFAALKGVTDLDIIWPMAYQAGGLQYGSEQHYGVRFEVQVKVNEA
jgi:hypothetical protein